MKYKIGQQVWHATFDATTASIVCPDCNGEGRIRCMLHDDTIVSVQCEGCRCGYEGSLGKIKVYTREARARLVTIAGVEINGEKIEWKTDDCYRPEEDSLFNNQSDCMAYAQKLAADYDREEREKINHKEKPTRSWAWNVHYHRRAIRDAQKQIEYHSSRLAIASLKAKDKSEAAA